MPASDYKLAMGLCQVFRLTELAHAEPNSFSKLHLSFDVEHRLSASFANMDVDRFVIVAVEEKSIAIFNKHRWHNTSLTAQRPRRAFQVTRPALSLAASLHSRTATARRESFRRGRRL